LSGRFSTTWRAAPRSSVVTRLIGLRSIGEVLG
jgi:hypothetical protein